MFTSERLLWTGASCVLTSLVWFGLYRYLRLRFKFGGECTSRIIASLHALLVTVFAYVSYTSGPDPFLEPGSESTIAHEATLVLSAGYFAYDMVWCLTHDTEPPIMLVHHAASLAAMIVILLSGTSGAVAVTGLGSLEVTNPLLQARWFLKSSGYNNTPVHSMVELSFVLLFFVMRVMFGTKLLVSIMGAPGVGYVVQASTVALYGISVIFMLYIARFVFWKYILGIRTQCCDFTCSQVDHIPHVPKPKKDKFAD